MNFYLNQGFAVYFGGTKAQWNAIRKDFDWNGYCNNYTIRCTDGIF